MFPYVYLFGGEISLYTICIFIGVIFAISVLKTLLFKRLLFGIYFPLILCSLVGLFVGAKFFAITSLCITDLIKSGKIDFVNCIMNSGIVYLGGLLGFLSVLYFLCKVKGLELKSISKEMVISITVFHAFGRMGCYFAGCCYGRLYDGFGSVPYRIEINEQFLPRFPTQVTEAIFELMLFCISLMLYKKSTGVNLSQYLFVYSFFRFFIEFFRGDEVRGIYGVLSFSQIICIIIVFAFIIKKLKSKRRTK